MSKMQLILKEIDKDTTTWQELNNNNKCAYCGHNKTKMFLCDQCTDEEKYEL